MKYNSVQARNHAASLFYQAAEEAEDRDIRKALRRIGDDIMEDHSGEFSPQKAQALEKLGASVGEYARLGLAQVIQNYGNRVRQVLRQTQDGAKGGAPMGLMDKIGGLFRKKEADPVQSTQSKMEVDIFDLEQQYEKYLDQYKKDYKKYQALAQKAVGLEHDSLEYDLIAREAKNCCKSMERHRSMMDQVYGVLEANRDAFEALEGGQALAQLKTKMPDAAQVAVMMEGFADTVEGMRAQREDLEDAVTESSSRIFAAGEQQSSKEGNMFDATVAKLKEKQRAEEEAAKRAQAEAEARAAAEAAEKAAQEAARQAEAAEAQRQAAKEAQPQAADQPEQTPAESAQAGVAATE